MKKLLAILLALAMVFTLAACGESKQAAEENTAPAEEPIKISFAWAETADEEGHDVSKAAYTFKRTIEEISGGKFEVELYPAAQLGDAASMLTQVQAGTLTACSSVATGIIGTSYYSNIGFLDIPYLFDSADEANVLLDIDSQFYKDMADEMAAECGIRPLCILNEGLRHTTNSKHAIKTPADFKGLKIRTMNVSAHIKMFETLGASATNISWGEVYQALQTNVVDGQENPLANAVYISAWEVQKYITLDGHFICGCLICMNEDFYKGLTAEQQAWVQEATKAAYNAAYAFYSSSEAKALQTLKDNGIEVTELTPEEIAVFRDACQAEVLDFVKSNMKNPEMCDKALQILEESRK